MATPREVPRQFPDDTGADIFVRQYPTAVAPADREYLGTGPPLFLFTVPGSGTAYERRVRRVVEALREPLDDNGKLAPYAVLEAGAGGELFADEVGKRLEFGIPRFMTPDRFPQFSLLRDVVTEILESRSAGGAGAGARALRDAAYRKRVERGGLPALLWGLGGSEPPAAGGAYAWLVQVVWQPLTHVLPRWCWARRTTRQLIRPARLSPFRRRRWLGVELGAERGKENLFRVMDEVAQRQIPRLALDPGHPQREEALQGLEDLLVRALLEDLRVPPARRFLPRRRRRTARPVILAELPGQEEAARPVERFLAAFHRARAATQPPGPLVIAVGRPSERLLHQLGEPAEVNLAQAGLQLNQREGAPVLVTLREEPFTRFGLPIRQIEPRMFRTSWRAMTSAVAAVAALAVLGGGISLRLAFGTPEEHPCVGGDRTLADASAAQGPPRLRAEEWYESVLGVIADENRRAEDFAKNRGRTVRTVVAFGSDPPSSATLTLFDGTIPELRGIAMWQRKLNDDADSDDSRVPLRVEVIPTGAGFAHAEREAEKLVEEIDSGQRKGARQVIGVLGYAQSKTETRAALTVLGEKGIPAIGTTATADEMLDSETYQSYWPFTPANSTEAGIEARFAGQQDIVARHRGAGCTPAEQAIVVQNSGDLYSSSLAEKFVKDFPGREKVVNFAQDGRFPGAPAGTPKVSSAHDLAETVCKALKEQPESMVFWSARARDFTAFVNALHTQGTCIQHDITVLGGNELTNVALTGAFDDKHWLRLYYSAHRLPENDAKASEKTRQFVEDYDRFVSGTTKGSDPWRQDGHSAVAYDAFHVLSRAADVTYRDKNADPRSMLTALSGGISFDGATGYVSYGQGSNAPPPDKTLVLLRQTAEGPVTVAACGAYQQGQETARQGPPCSPKASQQR
ncbi:ABC transporter substrate-binding protein [Streptomyces physcomitrii]|uniref:ABC transporter substrate-binding protein n=1 Tax=Streptomyces physcomitrii TaxID=2724184 RepID=UPI001B2FFF9F|nr:ABC transporter substrate-binding protein [Streptomyces physcomitrii]